MKIIGIDYGEKRIGFAISDELLIMAHPLKVVENKGFSNFLKDINQVIEEENITKIIIGLPINMDGTTGEQANKILKIIEDLRKEIKIPILPWDERLSSEEAHTYLAETGQSRKKRSKKIDKAAAAIILQGYLDHKD